MTINTKYRTNETEIMDDFTLKGEVLRDTLDKIATINQLLGGNQLTLQGVQVLLNGFSNSEELTIVDLGCGNGDMLRKLADYGIRNNLKLKLIGIDANSFTLNYARNLSVNYPNISYRCEDIFDTPFNELKYDIALCTLILHHFKGDEIIKLMTILNTNSRIGIVINDLQRSSISYRLFQVICFLFGLNKMSREDGLVSILRGFKKEELAQFSKELNLKKYKIQWKWAFRYQWIISK